MKKRSPGIILLVTLIAMTSGSICMNKVAPILTIITEDLAIANGVLSGLLISVFVVSGIFLSIPMGALIMKFGSFKTGVFSLLCIIAGSAVGAVATSYELMLASRVIEGVGLMFLATIGPAIVAASYSDEKRGTAMGIVMCFMAFGQIISYNLAPIVAISMNWHDFWWFSMAFGIVALVLWIAVIRGAEPESSEAETSEQGGSIAASLKSVLSNGGVWFCCLTMVAYMLSHMGVLNNLPTYLRGVVGLSTTTAGTVTSIATLVGIPVGILGGVLADKLGSIKKVLGCCMLLIAVLFILLNMFGSNGMTGMLIFAVVYGIVSMAQVGLCFTAVTSMVAPQDAGTASAVLNTAQWLGAFFSTVLFGMLLEGLGWNMSFYLMAPIALVGAVATFANKALR